MSAKQPVKQLTSWMKQKKGDGTGRFWDFCELCDAIAAEPKHTGKTHILEQFMEKQFSQDNCDTYLLFKLLLCGEDNRVYNMKDKQMVNLFSQIFNLDKKDLQDHLNDNGDVSETLMEHFEEENLNVTRSKYSLKKVDEFLDRLTTVTKQDDQIRILEQFIVNKVSGNELKYLARLIKHDLRIFAGAKFLLRALHPDAYNAFINSRDLKMVISKSMGQASLTQSLDASFDVDAFLMSDDADSDGDGDSNAKDGDASEVVDRKGKGKKRMGESEMDLTDDDLDDLAIPISGGSSGTRNNNNKKSAKRKFKELEVSDDENLEEEDRLAAAERLLQQVSKAKRSSNKKSKISTSMKLMQPVKPMLARATRDYDDALKRTPNGCFLEVKYDGERIQVHKDGADFKYYSRNLKPIMPYKVTDVESYLRRSTSANKVVLDGEILLIDTKTGEPLPFGTLGKHKKNQFKSAVVAIFFFDILHLEGKSLFNEPQDKRRKLLEKVVNVIPNRILVSEHVLCMGTADEREALLADRMGDAINKGLEGLVLKDIKSIYEPNARRWLKMKKDYLKGMADSADLVVLGAFYGTGNKGGIMSVYLMGCFDESSKKWKTVCKAGNGHDDKTLLSLNEELKDNMRKIDRDFSRLPDWIHCSREIVPDFIVINPKKSKVWEVTGAEFSKSEKHSAAGISIRFPRVTRIRSDKEIDDATTLKELIALKKASEKQAKVPLVPTKLKYEDAVEDEDDDNVAPPLPAAKKSRITGPDNQSSGSSGSNDSSSSNSNGNKSQPRKKLVMTSEDEDENDEDESDEEEEVTESDLTESELRAQNSREDLEIMQRPVEDELQQNLVYVYGEITRSIHNGKDDKILAHFVDDRGSWSSRGVMGELLQTFGNKCKQMYLDCFEREIDHRVGAAQLCPILNTDKGGLAENIWICNMITQKYFKKRNTCPIHWDSLKDALIALARYARRKKASVHLNKFHHTTSGLDGGRFDLYVYQFLVLKGIRVYIYTRDRSDKDKVFFCKKHTKDYTVLPDLIAQKSRTENAVRTGPEPGIVAGNGSSSGQSPTQRVERHEVMNSVRAFITGYPTAELSHLTSVVKSLGGNVQDTLNVLPSTRTTHVICDNPEDEGYSHAFQLGYNIVSRDWVLDCEKHAMLLDEQRYHLSDTNAASPNDMSDDNDDNDDNAASYSDDNDIVKPSSILGSSVEAAAAAASDQDQFALADIFSDMNIYIDSRASKFRELKRSIVAFDGMVMTSETPNGVTHVVTDAARRDDLTGEEIQQVLKANPNAIIVSTRWIHACVSRRSLVDHKPFAPIL